MILSDAQLQEYDDNGFLFVENVFNKSEIENLLSEMRNIIKEDCSRRILEKSGHLRSFFAPELSSNLYNRIVNSKTLVNPAMQILGGAVYKHQTKLNTKQALFGDWWEWHRDFTFWHKEDGMIEPKVITVMVFLSDTNEFNGPMLLIPGSHKEDSNASEEKLFKQDNKDSWFSDYHQSTKYMSSLTSDLKYTIKEDVLMKLIARNGICSIKGPAGSVLFFHGNLFHASSNNLSPWDRHAFLITYNSIDNKLPLMPDPRPEFISSRNFNSIIPVEEHYGYQ